jgi:hypothetical protein
VVEEKSFDISPSNSVKPGYGGNSFYHVKDQTNPERFHVSVASAVWFVPRIFA